MLSSVNLELKIEHFNTKTAISCTFFCPLALYILQKPYSPGKEAKKEYFAISANFYSYLDKKKKMEMKQS